MKPIKANGRLYVWGATAAEYPDAIRLSFTDYMRLQRSTAINWGGRNYINWDPSTWGEAPVGYTGLSKESWQKLNERVAAASVSTRAAPVNPVQVPKATFPKPPPRNRFGIPYDRSPEAVEARRVARGLPGVQVKPPYPRKKTPRGTPVTIGSLRDGKPLTKGEYAYAAEDLVPDSFNLSIVTGQRRIGAVTGSVQDMLEEAGFDFALTDSKSYGQNARILSGLSKSSLADVPESLSLAREWAETELRKVEQTYAEALLEVSRLRQQNELLKISLDSAHPMSRSAIRKEMAENRDKINAIKNGVSGLKDKTILRDMKQLGFDDNIRTLKSRVADLNSIALKLEVPTAMDLAGAPEKEIPRLFDKLEELHASNPALGEAIEAYKMDVRGIRGNISATDRFFRAYSAVGAGPRRVQRGALGGVLTDVQYMREYLPEGLHPGGTAFSDVSMGIVVKPRGIARAGMLEGLRHTVVQPSTVGDGTVDSALFRRFYALGKTSAAVDTVGRGVQNRITTALDEAIDSVTAGRELSSLDFRAYETAKSLYLGTLYRAPSVETSPKWGSPVPDLTDVIDDIQISSKTTHKSLLAAVLRRDDDFSNTVKQLLFELSPELQQYADEASYIDPEKLPKLLRVSAREMDIPASEKAFQAAVLGQARSDRGVDAMARRVSDEALSGMSVGTTTRMGPERVRVPYQLMEGNFDKRFSSKTLQESSDLLTAGIYEMLEEQGVKNAGHLRGYREALMIANYLNKRDIVMAQADITREGWMGLGLDEDTARAYEVLTEAARRKLTHKRTALTDVNRAKARKSLLKPTDMRLIDPTSPDTRTDEVLRGLSTALEKHRRRAMMNTMQSADPAVANVIDYAMKGRGVDPFMGKTRADILTNLNQLWADRAMISVGTEDFRTNLIMEGLEGGLVGDGTADRITVKYSLQGDYGERVQALLNMGLSDEEAQSLAKSKVGLMQEYEYRSFSDVMGSDFGSYGIDQDDLENYGKFLRGYLGKKNLTKHQVNEIVQMEMDELARMSPENIREAFTGMSDLGGFFPVDNSARILDLHTEGFLDDAVGAVGRINTVSAERATFGQMLLDRTYGMQGGFGRPSDRFRNSKESIFDVVDGKVTINRRLMPREELATGGSRAMEMSDEARAVLDDIISRLGGNDEMMRLLSQTTIDPVTGVPKSLMNDIFNLGKSETGALIRPFNKLYGPLAQGNVVEISHGIDSFATRRVRELGGIDPASTYKETLSLGEVFARALASGEMGADAPGPNYADIFVNTVKDHSARMSDERLMEFYGEDAARAFGRAGSEAEGGARAAASGAGEMFSQTPINKETIAKLWKDHKSIRYGSAAVAGLAAWGIYRGHRRKKDHTMEDMAGPSNLPGGSAYENSPQGFTTYNTGEFSRQASGMTYRVDVNGQFDPRLMLGEMNSFVGGSTVLNAGQISKGMHNQPKTIEDLSNGY